MTSILEGSRAQTRPDAREIADPDRIMVADGAMGTMLYSRGVFINQCYDELNVRSPELVLDVHRAVREGGRRAARDEQLRREPAEAGAVRARESRGGVQPSRGRDRARGSRRERARRGRRRAARRAHRAIRRHQPRGGARTFSRADARAARGRRGLLSPRDVQRSRRDRAGARRGARALAVDASHRANDDRPGWAHAVRRHSRGCRAHARRMGRGRHRPQLLGGAAGDSRGDRAHGRGDEAQAERAAECRHAARCLGAHDVHGEPRVHGELRAPLHTGRREAHRRLLRHHARAHQVTRGRNPPAHAAQSAQAERALPDAARAGPRGDGQRSGNERRSRGHAVRASFALGEQDRAKRVRHVSRDRAAARRGCDRDARGGRCAQGCGRRRSERSRWPACAEPHGRAHDESPHRAAHGNGDRHALLLSRSQPPRHAERPARRIRDGAAQSAHHHGRSAEDGTLSRRDRGVRHRFHRPHESRQPPQQGTRSQAATHLDAPLHSRLASV